MCGVLLLIEHSYNHVLGRFNYQIWTLFIGVKLLNTVLYLRRGGRFFQRVDRFQFSLQFFTQIPNFSLHFLINITRPYMGV